MHHGLGRVGYPREQWSLSALLYTSNGQYQSLAGFCLNEMKSQKTRCLIQPAFSHPICQEARVSFTKAFVLGLWQISGTEPP